MDFDVQKTSRICSASGRQIAAGETFYSLLVREGSAVVRRDYSHEHWKEPPAEAIAWWSATMPERDGTGKRKMAPSEVLLELFRNLADDPEKRDLRYVLTLLLLRRRLLRLEETTNEPNVGEVLTLYCPRDEQTYRLEAVPPSARRIHEIQSYLAELLFAGNETPGAA